VKPSLIPAAVLFCAIPMCAQSTGTSHPEQLDDTITAQPATPPAKPSPAIPMGQAQSYPNGDVQNYQASPADNADDHYVKPSHDNDSSYTPYNGNGTSRGGVVHQPVSSLPPNEQLAGQPQSATAYDRSQDPQFAHRDDDTYRPYNPSPSSQHHEDFAVTDDPTSGVVMDVPTPPNQIPQSTMLRTRLVTTLSTRTTKAGDPFTATLAGDVVRNGRVLLPYGSTIHGHVTAAHGGHGLSSASVLRLEANSITLPDGSTYPLMAEVVDLGNIPGVHVTSEGTIKDNAMTRGQATMLGSTTGGGAIAGALVGGGVGAAVGATIGAGVGTVLYLRRDREQTLPARSELIFALDTPLDLSSGAKSDRF
jgi:hypothetical protein